MSILLCPFGQLVAHDLVDLSFTQRRVEYATDDLHGCMCTRFVHVVGEEVHHQLPIRGGGWSAAIQHLLDSRIHHLVRRN